MTDLMLSEPNDFFLWRFDGPSFPAPLKTVVTSTIAKDILTCKKQPLSAFIHYATLFSHCKCLWRPEIRKGYISISWNYCAGKAFTFRQTDGNWMNIAQYCPLTIKFFLFFCTILNVDGQQYCAIINIAKHYWLSRGTFTLSFTHDPTLIHRYNLAFTCPGIFLYRMNKTKKGLRSWLDLKRGSFYRRENALPLWRLKFWASRCSFSLCMWNVPTLIEILLHEFPH
jgi:hypothetical protein